MPDRSFDAELAGLRAQLEAAIAERATAVISAHAVALDEARRNAWEEATRDVDARLGAARREADAHLAAARDEADTRLDAALEQAAAAADRQVEAAVATAVAAARAEAEAAASRDRQRQRRVPDTSRLLDAVTAIDAATSLTAILSALCDGAAALGPRAVLFLRDGEALSPWRAGKLPLPETPGPGTLLDEALRTGVPASTASAAAPAFAQLSDGQSALAVPLTVDGAVVAVLYTDEATAEPPPASWGETAIVLARHASVCLTHLTLLRTTQAFRARARTSAADRGPDAEVESARRFARLVVSEIKLYHEAEVRIGRQHGDLLARLASEIARAEASFDARVPPTLPGRDGYFRQELVQILAGGDARLLGEPREPGAAPGPM